MADDDKPVEVLLGFEIANVPIELVGSVDNENNIDVTLSDYSLSYLRENPIGEITKATESLANALGEEVQKQDLNLTGELQKVVKSESKLPEVYLSHLEFRSGSHVTIGVFVKLESVELYALKVTKVGVKIRYDLSNSESD